MTQPYYQPGPQGPPGPPPRQGPYAVLPPRYRALRTIGIVAIALMGVTALLTAVQSVLMWRSYDKVKDFIFLNVSEDDLDGLVDTMVGANWALNVVGYLMFGTAIVYLLWLWYARENTDFLNSTLAPRPPANPLPPGEGLHRRSAGWIIGAWFCPVVQFWYPLQLVQDITVASEPLDQPGAARSPRIKALIYTWWAGWTGYWVIVWASLLAISIGFITFIVQAVEASEDAEGSVKFYGLQDVMVQVALWVDIGFSIAALLLIVATIASALLMLQIGQWQQQRMQAPPPPPVQDYYRPPPAFPSYRPQQ
ncbi:DUF4328 domain-containing protein [Kribbella antibiotica]|uniref:DUF4328 domain-containing protein n=1 Tax=Kribbella antibiotica TaxID=190195 RepID=A0A4R4ZLR9_9ACTN|nr:DUF4328 domain-containing protein [Kribbella antibiotica]TDD59046.1 DUF4328 domain-containing protein [Kribbella antibiotica]